MLVTELEIDDHNETHLTRHGVSVTEVHQVFTNMPEIRPNRRNRSSTHVARGVTDGGRRVMVGK